MVATLVVLGVFVLVKDSKTGVPVIVAPEASRESPVTRVEWVGKRETADVDIDAEDVEWVGKMEKADVQIESKNDGSWAPELEFVGSGADMGQCYLGEPGKGVCRVTNKGPLPMTITGIRLAGANENHFRILSGGGTGTLLAGGSRQIHVQYEANAPGNHGALVRVDFEYRGVPGYIGLELRGETVIARMDEADRQWSAKPQERSKRSFTFMGFLPDWLESRFFMIAYRRADFVGVSEVGSNIDRDVVFHSAIDIVKYVPRALQIGFLAPFPKHWFERARNTGPMSRGIAGAEMVGWYVLIPGFLYFLIAGDARPAVRMWLLAYSLGLVVLTSLVVINLGALFRMRYAFLLPVLLGGLQGWANWKWLQRLAHRIEKRPFSIWELVKT
jgi:hypothetical protein